MPVKLFALSCLKWVVVMNKELIEKYMRIAIEEAMIAKLEGENPFGAVLLDSNNNFCAKAHSQSIKLCDPTAHAEVLAIRNYCKDKKLIYLKDYTLISSAEPCVMCSGAIHWAKIQNIYYSVSQERINEISGGKKKPSCESLINTGNNKKNIVGNILLDEGLNIISKQL